MTDCELRILEQTEDYRSPFEYDTEGFNDQWWHGRAGPVGDTTLGGTIYVQFLKDDLEIGRAELTPWKLSASYVGLNKSLPCLQIWFFEIRTQFRGKDFGSMFASRLAEHFSDLPLIAFSEGADKFWDSIGWYYFPRKDGKTQSYRKLFVSRTLSRTG